MTETHDFKSLDKWERKQLIIDTAVRIFHEKGYHAATLDDVAGRLGVTKAALYHYVSSKENLLSQIYIKALEGFFAYIYEIPSMELSPAEKMRTFIRRHLKSVVIENLAMFSVFFSEENQLPKEDFLKIREEKRKFTFVVEEIIQDGIDRGSFRRVNPKLTAYAVIGMCNWLYLWYKPESSLFTPDEIADHFVALLENGYVQPENPDHAATCNGKRTEDRGAVLERKRGLLGELRQNTDRIASLVEELNMIV